MPSQPIQQSDYRIRKLIGTLGLALPVLLPLSEGMLLSSMSHYYYQPLSSLIFVIILASFGLFLLSYKGYKIDSKTEKISDDLLTNIGGISALIVVFVPTYCLESSSPVIDEICASGEYPLLGHIDGLKNTIHLIFAGIFIFTMGWMSKYKFTRGEQTSKNRFYKWCGNLVWIAIGLLVVLVIIDFFNEDFQITPYDVFFLETLAVVPFGISWFIKGEAMENIKSLFSKTDTSQ
ncbi:hypothetical protein FEE95_00725 [Maribacter algarum]|uniref:DUF998 domain-containing protein n=1 Tax=Maribacter algarum (ex Zhang et al. 2020) TaxID=2578118 RepID=A0A5S3QJI4_9FLAO|nr:hypothetical protein [Maribacter algarum]TMM57984.1 hypothetical protein FEE95_00725 [Maribacter algarum]